MKRGILAIGLMLCVVLAGHAQNDTVQLMIDSLTRELKEMKLK